MSRGCFSCFVLSGFCFILSHAFAFYIHLSNSRVPKNHSGLNKLVEWWKPAHDNSHRTCMQFSMDIRSCASMRRTHSSMQRKTRKSIASFPKESVTRYHARGAHLDNPWWELTRQLYGRRKVAKKFTELVVSATVRLSRAVS